MAPTPVQGRNLRELLCNKTSEAIFKALLKRIKALLRAWVSAKNHKLKPPQYSVSLLVVHNCLSPRGRVGPEDAENAAQGCSASVRTNPPAPRPGGRSGREARAGAGDAAPRGVRGERPARPLGRGPGAGPGGWASGRARPPLTARRRWPPARHRRRLRGRCRPEALAAPRAKPPTRPACREDTGQRAAGIRPAGPRPRPLTPDLDPTRGPAPSPSPNP